MFCDAELFEVEISWLGEEFVFTKHLQTEKCHKPEDEAQLLLKYLFKSVILLRFNSLPCGTDCCSRMAAGPANV